MKTQIKLNLIIMKNLLTILFLVFFSGALSAQSQIATTSNTPPDGFVYHNPGNAGERCIATCPPGGYEEGEPCGADYNGGCNMQPTPVFQPVNCGDIVCGNAWWDPGQGLRDTDWYEIILTKNEPVTLRLYSEAESTQFGLIEQYVPGVPGCDNITGSTNPYLYAPGCTESVIDLNIGPGTYYFFVGLDFSGPPYLCVDGGANYTLSIECPEEVPVSSWAIYLGIGLILIFSIIRFP